VPRIKPARSEQRKAFRRKLPPGLRNAFNKLARLIDNPRRDLDWYHRVGLLTRRLCPRDRPGYHGQRCLFKLAEVLGPQQWMLRKAVRFVELYPTKKAVRELKRRRVGWTRLKLSFPIRDARKRLALLTEAVRKRWSIARFRFEAQRRHPTGHRGVGGRRPRRLRYIGPVTGLEELLTATRAWLRVHRQVWETKSEDFQGRVQQLLRKRDDAAKVLSDLKRACRKLNW
jgi:hypothetical protein